MKILYIGNLNDVHNFKWMSFFSKKGIEIFATFEEEKGSSLKNEVIGKYSELGIKILSPITTFSILNPANTIKSIRFLNNQIEKNKIDFVHMLFATHSLYGPFLKKPFFTTSRGSDILIFIPV